MNSSGAGNLLTDPSVAFDTHAPERVVSLVPSTTASLFDLGLGEALVGVTDYCFVPDFWASELVRIGGPRSLDVDAIFRLKPDLILANQEENDREAVKALADAGIPVWLAFPRTVRESINDLWTLANLFRAEQAMAQVDLLEKSTEWAAMAASGQMPIRYFCPIWQDTLENSQPWWMTFNRQTYASDVLALFGGENIFAERERHYPLLADLGLAAAEPAGERDTRYPCVTPEEVLAGQPELILLPSEPFAFDDQHAAEFQRLFADTPAAKAGRIFTLDGSLITWHGTRLARALEDLPLLFNV